MSYRGRGGSRGGGGSQWDAKRKRPNPDCSDDEMDMEDFHGDDELFTENMPEDAEYGEMAASSASTASKEHWRRPQVNPHNAFKDSLVFQQLDIDHYIGKVSYNTIFALFNILWKLYILSPIADGPLLYDM